MKASNILTLFISIASIIYFDFIGRITLSEIISIPVLVFISKKSLFERFPSLFWLFKYLLFYLIVQMVSDIYNNVDFVDFSRGWAVIIFALISTLILVKLFSISDSNIFFYLIGLFLVNFFSGGLFLQNSVESSNFFKTNIVSFLNPLVLLFSIYLTTSYSKILPILLFFFYGIISFYFDGRSNGIVFILAALLLIFSKSQLNGFRLLFLSMKTLFILFLVFVLYVYSVESGFIAGSNSTKQLEKSESKYNPLELLKVGRAEVFVSISAALEKPLLGHGSWAKDKTGYFNLLLFELNGHKSSSENDFIPSHSLLFGGFLYAGILGFLSLLMLMIRFITVTLVNLNKKNKGDIYLPLYTFLICDMTWAMFFSPFGLLRTIFPFFAAVLIVRFTKKM